MTKYGVDRTARKKITIQFYRHRSLTSKIVVLEMAMQFSSTKLSNVRRKVVDEDVHFLLSGQTETIITTVRESPNDDDFSQNFGRKSFHKIDLFTLSEVTANSKQVWSIVKFQQQNRSLCFYFRREVRSISRSGSVVKFYGR